MAKEKLCLSCGHAKGYHRLGKICQLQRARCTVGGCRCPGYRFDQTTKENILEFKDNGEVWGTDESPQCGGRYLMGTIEDRDGELHFVLTNFRVSDTLTVRDMTQIIDEIKKRSK